MGQQCKFLARIFVSFPNLIEGNLVWSTVQYVLQIVDGLTFPLTPFKETFPTGALAGHAWI